MTFMDHNIFLILFFFKLTAIKILVIININMVYKRGKLKGQLTTAEIRKLISAHNKLSKITIPPRSTREEILALLDKNGFSVDHEKELLVQKTAQKMDINLEKAKEVTKREPKAQPKPKEVLAIKDKPKEEKKK